MPKEYDQTLLKSVRTTEAKDVRSIRSGENLLVLLIALEIDFPQSWKTYQCMPFSHQIQQKPDFQNALPGKHEQFPQFRLDIFDK